MPRAHDDCKLRDEWLVQDKYKERVDKYKESFGDVLRRPVIHSDFLERNKTFEENCIAVFRSCYI